jgi:hypothetical protein
MARKFDELRRKMSPERRRQNAADAQRALLAMRKKGASKGKRSTYR